MKHIFRILAGIFVLSVSVSAMATVTATLDRNNIALGDTARLSLQNDGNADGQPDIEPLKRDFNVLGSSHGSSMQIVNGHSSSQTILTLFIAPKHEGKIQIPALHWGAQQSAPLEMTVSGQLGNASSANSGNAGQAASNAPAESGALFFTTSLSQKQAYVQSALVLTMRLYVGAQISQASLDLPGTSDVIVKQLGKDQQTSENRDGHNYQVVERKYLLLPQRSGKISLKGPVLDAQVQDTSASDPMDIDSFFSSVFGRSSLGGMLGAMRPIHLMAKNIEFTVLPRPASATGSNWLPAQKLTLQENWRPESGPLHVGEPMTRHLQLSAAGLTGAQLPDLGSLMTVPDGFKMYPDQAKTDDQLNGNTMTGNREQDIAIIASNPGKYTLPALHLSWWDTLNDVQREADLPARSLEILPAIAGQKTALVPPSDHQANALNLLGPAISGGKQISLSSRLAPWQWISAALGVLWLVTMLAWWRSSNSSKKATPIVAASKMEPTNTGASLDSVAMAASSADLQPPLEKANAFKLSTSSSLRSLQLACRNNDPLSARQHVLEWAAGFWPDAAPRGLTEVAQRLDDVRYAGPLQQLDRACYIDQSGWQGEALALAFAAPPRHAKPEKKAEIIPDLYL